MPRRLRVHLENGFYHVTLRGNHQEQIFRASSDRNLLNAIVSKSLSRFDARLHAYCWMTNHLHLLVQVGAPPLGDVMRQIASGYARAYQQKLETTGHLFERRYYAKLVMDDVYLLSLLRYIHLNPVDAGLVRLASEYPWSSHKAYAGGLREPWLTTDFVLSLFSAHRDRAHAEYVRFMAEGDPDWKPCEDESPLEKSLRFQAKKTAPTIGARPSVPESLEALCNETCVRFAVAADDLTGHSRNPEVVQARGWLAEQARLRRVASLSEVARRLGRDRATLRYAIRRLDKGQG